MSLLEFWYGLDDRKAFVLALVSVHFVTLFVYYFFIKVIDNYKLFEQYKIIRDQSPFPDDKLVQSSFVEFVLKTLISQPLSLYFVYPYLVDTFGALSFSGPIPSVEVILKDFLVFAVIIDTLFYWIHRALHHKYLYKSIHKKHHEFKVNVVVNTEYAHPLEDTVTNVIPFLIGPILMKSHAVTVILWFFYRMLEALDAHSNYDFPISHYLFLRSPALHAYHHSHNIGCYGINFFWDWAMGTDSHYREHIRKEQAGKKK